MNKMEVGEDTLRVFTEQLRVFEGSDLAARLFQACIACARAGDEAQLKLLWARFMSAKEDMTRKSITFSPKRLHELNQWTMDAEYAINGFCKENSLSKQNLTKVFISHSSKDTPYVAALVELLEAIGLRENRMFCSSVAGYGIPLNEDIYEYLRQLFVEYKLHVIFVLSNNYYNSVACLNEMGAAWALKSTYTTLLLPGFEYCKIEGAINPRQIGLKLTKDSSGWENERERLGQLRDQLSSEFDLPSLPVPRWERKREHFIQFIANI